MKSRLVSTFLLWLLLLLAAAPASAVMDVQPRNHAWEPSASSYDLAPDVRDGPNLYAYVKQNPWTSFDPDGLAETAVTKAIKERSQLVVQAYESAGSEDGAAAQKAQFTRGQAVAGAMAKGLNEVVTNTPLGAANEALTGKDASGEPLSAVERLAVMAGFIPAGKFAGRLGKAGVDALSASAQEISKKADEIVDAIRKGGDGAAKRGPKTDPTAPHNAKIKSEGDRLADEGNEILAGGGRAPEKAIPTPGGNKGSRRPDVLYKTPDGTTKGLNVGKTKADGSPVTREQEAMDDLNGAGVETDFIPYDR